MERCLDCNSVLTSKEKVCPTCGAKVGLGALSPAELFARAGTVAFYGAVLAFLVSRFTPNAASSSVSSRTAWRSPPRATRVRRPRRCAPRPPPKNTSKMSLKSPNGFPVQLSVVFNAEYSVNGGGPQGLPPIAHTYASDYRVQEAQAIVTTH